MANKPDKSDFEYNSQLDAFELYHLVLEDSSRPSHRNGGPVLPALGHAVSGSVATATSKLLIYPLDLIIARMQVQKQLRSPKSPRGSQTQYAGPLEAAIKIYQHEGGLSAFYTGCLTDVTKGIADSFLFFLAYSFLQQRALRKTSHKHMTVAQEMGIGIAAGSFARLITTPLQNIITRQQTAALAVAQDTKSDESLKKGDSLSTLDIAKQIHQERGVAGFWTGYSLSLILTLNPAITFAVDNFLQKTLRAKDSSSHATFLIAAVSKAIATTITYPVSVAKARAQARTQANDQNDAKSVNSKNRSLVSKLAQLFAAQYAMVLSLRKIYQQDGMSGLYSGIEAEVVKGFLSHGLTMVMKDRVHGGIIELYYILLRLTSNWPTELVAGQEAVGELVDDAAERAENVGVTAYEAGKSAAHNVTQRASNLGSTVVEASKSAVNDVAERASSIGSSVFETGKSAVGNVTERASNIGSTVVEAGKNAVNGVVERVENVSSTVSQAGKNIATSTTDRAAGIVEAGRKVASDAAQRAENVGVTAYEAGKSATTNTLGGAYTTGQDIVAGGASRAENIGVTAVEAGKSAASGVTNGSVSVGNSVLKTGETIAADVGNRAENIGVTALEAGKSAVAAVGSQTSNVGNNATEVGKTLASEARERLDNIGVSTIEAGKSIARDVKK